MRSHRRFPIPAVPPTALVPAPGRRVEDALPQAVGRVSRLLLGVVSAGLGLVGGVCLHALVVVPPSAAPPLTAQQHALYLLVQDLAQTTTREEVWQVLTRMEQVLRPLHPQPRPQPEPLLPSVQPATVPVAQ
jgi:hypothetical protein